MSILLTPPVLASRPMTDASQHAVDIQLAAIRASVTYGALALAGLIAANLVGYATAPASFQAPYVVGLALGVFSAFAAYLNFAAIVSGWKYVIIPAMGASMLAGFGSAIMFLQGAL